MWDAATGAVKQQFSFHNKPTLDVRLAPLGPRRPRGHARHARRPSLPQVDWRDETSFASCSTDKMVYVCKVGQDSYLKCFEGHQDEARAPRLRPRATAGRPLPRSAPPRR